MEIFWGIISAILIFLFRESLSNARQQKEIAARLASYILHWKMKLIKEDGFFKLSYIGMKWQTEINKKMRSGTKAEEITKVDKEYEEKLNKMFQELEKNSIEIIGSIKEGLGKLEANGALKSELIALLKSYKESLLNGNMFISDQDASKLGHGYSYACVSLKSHLISLVESGILFILMFESKNLEYDKFKKLFESMLKDWIYASKDMEFLSSVIDKYTKASTVNVAVKDLLNAL